MIIVLYSSHFSVIYLYFYIQSSLPATLGQLYFYVLFFTFIEMLNLNLQRQGSSVHFSIFWKFFKVFQIIPSFDLANCFKILSFGRAKFRYLIVSSVLGKLFKMTILIILVDLNIEFTNSHYLMLFAFFMLEVNIKIMRILKYETFSFIFNQSQLIG